MVIFDSRDTGCTHLEKGSSELERKQMLIFSGNNAIIQIFLDIEHLIFKAFTMKRFKCIS